MCRLFPVNAGRSKGCVVWSGLRTLMPRFSPEGDDNRLAVRRRCFVKVDSGDHFFLFLF